MAAALLVLALVIITVLLVKAVLDSRQQLPQRPSGARSRTPAPPLPNRLPRTARRRPGSQPDLAGHAVELRKAVTAGLVTEDEAIASLVRQSDGGLDDPAARRMLADAS